MKTCLRMALLATTVLTLGLASQAEAAPLLQMNLSDGTTTVHLTDTASINGLTTIFNSTAGQLAFSVPFGNWVTNGSTGVGSPIIGTVPYPAIDFGSLNVASAAGGTLTLKLTQTGNIGLGVAERFLANIGGVASQNPGSALSYQAYVDNTDTP
ncbi:MAG TPA: hypothetical protein VGC80_07350, partial [Acetobacteraceae bacterium]